MFSFDLPLFVQMRLKQPAQGLSWEIGNRPLK